MPSIQDLAGLQGAPDQGVGQMAGQGVQKAVEALMGAMQLMNIAIEADPSLTAILRPMMQKTFLTVADHYGHGEEAKLALKKAKMQGPQGPPMGAPAGAPPTGAPAPGGPPGPPM